MYKNFIPILTIMILKYHDKDSTIVLPNSTCYYYGGFEGMTPGKFWKTDPLRLNLRALESQSCML